MVLKSSDLKSANHANILSLGGFTENLLAASTGDLTAQSFDENPKLFENFRIYSAWHHAYNKMCETSLRIHKENFERLKEEKYDIIFSEMLNLCGTGLKEVLGIKAHLWVSSCPVMDHMAWILGMPTPLSYVPTVGDLDISDKPSYLESQNFPDIEQIAKDSPITFVAADEILDFPRPILHNTIYVGGLGVKNNAKGLQEPYKSELKKGKEGVVFFSLGSQANTNKVPRAVKENLFKVFKEFPDYHFIVKINEGDK
uniref:glucuronosyltransferase n=1 Tax=Acrobeloides nanus TaxID=290746 RepID=A0A914D273_9BILA